MATLDSNSRIVVDHAAGTPDDPNLASLADLAAVLTTSTSVSLVASRLVSTSAAGSLDSVPVSTADSKAVSSGTRASVADSKALSGSIPTSVADSKALSVSSSTSIADSKAVSVASSVPILTVVAASQSVSIAASKGDSAAALGVAAASRATSIAAATSLPAIVPGSGRTTASLTTYLLNNAVGNVKDFGAVGDGVTDDTARIQAAINYCFGTAASPHGFANAALNHPLYFPAGTYLVTSPLTVPKVVGGLIFGDGRNATIIKTATANTAVMVTNGFAYSRVVGICFLSTASNTGTVFDLDWDGTTGGSALQSNTFSDCYFSGNSTNAYGLRIGVSGFMGSEVTFVECFWDAFTVAGVLSNNFNALQNGFIECNFQSCTKYGIRVASGNLNVFSTGFQNSGTSAAQVTANGFDISIANSSDDCSSIIGCRSESFRFLEQQNNHTVDVRGCNVIPAVLHWTTLTAVALNALYTGTITAGDGKLYRCTTAGTTAAGEPTWTGATVNDGTVVWTLVDYSTVVGGPGLSLARCILLYGTLSISQTTSDKALADVTKCTFSRTDWLPATGGVGYGVAGSYLELDGNVVTLGGGPNTGGALQSYASHSTSGPVAPVSAKTQRNFGSMPVLWSTGTGGNGNGDVGFIPASGSNATAALNVLGLVGTLGGVAPTAANTAGNDTILTGGQGTGTGASGKLRLRAAPAGGAGSTLNTPIDVGFVDEAGLTLTTAGTGFKVKEGTNATMGTAVLVAGTLVVATTKVTASSRIQLTSNIDGGTPGWLRVSARTAGTSFTITSSSGTDTSTVAWFLVEPS